MAFDGQIARIPLGKGGLLTDSPLTDISPVNLIRADNVSLHWDLLEKDYGSMRWNSSALPSGVIQIQDLWLNPTTQRVFAVCRNGQVYKFSNYYTFTTITPTGTAPTNLNSMNYANTVAGGNETNSANKKVFIFTGNDPVQVISGDNNTRSTIAHGASDWTGTSQPTGGIVYRNRLWAWLGHQVYVSLASDHEDFTTASLQFSVWPGFSERIIGGAVVRGRFYLYKYPFGVYQLVDDDLDSANWYFTQFADDFGGASANGGAQVKDDYILFNSFASLTSLKAALIFGDLSISDILQQSKVYRYFLNDVNKGTTDVTHGVYYKRKSTLLFSYRPNDSYLPARILSIDMSNPNAAPKISTISKDQPNCLKLVKDDEKQDIPFYGSEDGYIYKMDSENRWVGTADAVTKTGYAMDVWTADTDFSAINPLLAQQNKDYSKLEVLFESSGNWNLTVDAYIDGKFSQTFEVPMTSQRSDLDESHLGIAPIDGRVPSSKLFLLNGIGRKIGFRLYNNGTGENCRLIELKVFYKVSGNQQEKK